MTKALISRGERVTRWEEKARGLRPAAPASSTAAAEIQTPGSSVFWERRAESAAAPMLKEGVARGPESGAAEKLKAAARAARTAEGPTEVKVREAGYTASSCSEGGNSAIRSTVTGAEREPRPAS